MNLESPCAFCSTPSFEAESKYFTHTYTICPYTAEWLMARSDIKAYPIAFPYNGNCFKDVKIEEKDTASMYMGTIMCEDHEKIIEVIKKNSHVICSLSPHPQLTHLNISSKQKWNLLGKAKSNVIMNMCPVNETHKIHIMSNQGVDDHGAFNRLHLDFMPQFKPRVIESMVCKAVCLVKRDPWNVIETWFSPDKHFIYWETYEELYSLINDIDKNYDSYTDIVNAAHQEVKRHEIKAVFNKIKEDINE